MQVCVAMCEEWKFANIKSMKSAISPKNSAIDGFDDANALDVDATGEVQFERHCSWTVLGSKMVPKILQTNSNFSMSCLQHWQARCLQS